MLIQADEKLRLLKEAWKRQIISVTTSPDQAREIVHLAELNGLFDAAKETFAREDD